jgi:hypothetical protein
MTEDFFILTNAMLSYSGEFLAFSISSLSHYLSLYLSCPPSLSSLSSSVSLTSLSVARMVLAISYFFGLVMTALQIVEPHSSFSGRKLPLRRCQSIICR